MGGWIYYLHLSPFGTYPFISLSSGKWAETWVYIVSEYVLWRSAYSFTSEVLKQTVIFLALLRMTEVEGKIETLTLQ